MIKRSLLALSFSVVAMAGGLSAVADEARPLRVGYVFAMANAPALIADKQGYYREEGLTVDLKALGDGPVIQQALAAGELDVAYVGTPPVYQWFSRGLQSRILAKVNYGQAAVIVDSKSLITSLAGLKGKKLAGVKKGSGMDVLLRGYVLKEKAGLDPETDLSIIDMPPGNMNAALERGIVDAAFSWEPFVSQSLLRGSSRVLFDVNQALPEYPWYVVIALPKTLQERPDDVVKLLRAHRRAIAFLNEHPAESNRIIAEAFKLEAVQGPDGSTIAPETIVAQARSRLGWSADLQDADIRFIQRLMNYSHDLGFIDVALKTEQIVDTTYLEKASR
ncbi:ABC transporter substrate-binding protein [Pseudomonas gingeri]|uniref:ABC transporter substrate-binding protein n=1 Tax=Pseudomonas gingeri TaxID=117681 RepID=A0A7Y7YAI9_9PSED|nr:ABC transporter substrate-binding protein [Pseudomonas gingeri]NWA01723.1 ABC transporter substrate-binding protein [Pseudomonas gingeri]NWA12822.1 ABC transporter substrate-binding protein [Pseudomonas gingeri]NWA57564.1 ABC transporter substrate-binding protein [Pseudomonas gingeri]NWA93193.1 ABC transporter substrate-binding protein [Pseudomonas gingeri]NWB03447.1 ABC transporter substrate-binding protein [Pseudomonas gingeri]